MKKICESICANEDRLENEKARLDSLESTVNKRLADLDKLKAGIRRETVTIENLKQELIEDGLLDSNGQDESCAKGRSAAISSELERINSLILENVNRTSEIHGIMSEAVNERNFIQQQRDKLLSTIKQLDDSRHQKMEQLNLKDQHTYEAVKWIQMNRAKFKQAVFEPVALEINVPDKRYYFLVVLIISIAKVVESLLGRNTLSVIFFMYNI